VANFLELLVFFELLKSQQLNLRRKAAKPRKAQPSRETVVPPSGTPTPAGLTLTSSMDTVPTPETTLNNRFVLVPEAVALNLKWV
jgi:hypothetical protein